MRLPTWEELESVDEQLDVLEWPLDETIFVAGPPGSGKTVLAVRRAQMVAEGEPDTVILTYNRMLRRLMELLSKQSGMTQADEIAAFTGTIATMQSYVWSDYGKRTKSEPPTPPDDRYAYIWSEMLHILEQRGDAQNRAHLVVDEGQDLAEGFFEYASRYISQTMSVFADDDQALSNQRTTLEQIRRAANLPDPIILTQNHRNTPQIARLAEHFHAGRLPAATVRRSSSGGLPCVAEKWSLETVARRISNSMQTQGGSTGVVVDRNETGQRVLLLLREGPPKFRVQFYTYNSRNEDQTNVLEDGVTILNKESVKGQEFDTVFILELHRFLPCKSDRERRSMYMMCSRARDNLWLICGPDGRLTQTISDALPGPEIVECV